MIQQVLMDLLIEEPYLGYLASRVHFLESQGEKSLRTDFTNGVTLIYNGKWLEAQPPAHRRGLVSHELLHLSLLHFYRRENRDPILWHMACDLAVTELLDKKFIPEDILTLQSLFRELGILLPPKKDAETYYGLLEDNEDKVDYTYNKKEKTLTFKSGKPYQGEPLSDQKEMSLASLAIIDDLARLQVTASYEGALSQEIKTMTEKTYEPYLIDWRGILKRFLGGQGRIQVRKSYKKQSKRFEDLPGNKRTRGLKALIALDESASVSNLDVEAFHQELLRINSITGTDLTVVRFDDSVSEPVPLRKFVSESGRKRRGGTDFRPVFALADQLKMPMIVIFTDGEGEAPREVNQKVLWVLLEGGRMPASYGFHVAFRK